MMKKLLLFSMICILPTLVMAQDDMYFVPKKKSNVKAATQTYYAGSSRDVDEYNRRGKFNSSVSDITDSDIINFDGKRGIYPDSIYVDTLFADRVMQYEADKEDYAYTRMLNRWYGYYDPWFYSMGYISPWSYYGPRWYSPYYYSYWYDGYYDPWYYRSYWGTPWYYRSYWGWSPFYYGGYYGGYHGGYWGGTIYHNTENRGAAGGYSNRGRADISRQGLAGSNRIVGGNVYNNISKRSEGNSRIVRSTRSTGTRTFNNTYNNTFDNSRSYDSPGNNRSYNSSRSTGSFSNGGSSMGGGSSRGGSISGGSRGGRR